MKLKYLVFALFMTVVFSACNKFLDIKPKGLILPETVVITKDC